MSLLIAVDTRRLRLIFTREKPTSIARRGGFPAWCWDIWAPRGTLVGLCTICRIARI
jgi:hypothetical protein